jgi:hypothetical protein
MPVNPAPESLRQEDCKFKVSLSHKLTSCLKKRKKKKGISRTQSRENNPLRAYIKPLARIRERKYICWLCGSVGRAPA